jgi:general secretion pathway protein G
MATTRSLPDHRSAHARGFTLLELMVVLLILALITSIAAPRVTKYLSQAKTQAAKIQVTALSAAVESFYLDTGRFPSTDEGLRVLMDAPTATASWRGPYLRQRESLIDPWGQAYLYKLPGRDAEFDVYTLAADRREGGSGDDADIGNW